jgi:hypothetical protein
VTILNVVVLVCDHLIWIGQVLMVAERMAGALAHPGMIEEMDRELSDVIDDFDRAVNVEALRLAKESGK